MAGLGWPARSRIVLVSSGGGCPGRRGDDGGCRCRAALTRAQDVLGAVSLPEEREWIAGQARAQPGVCWDRLLFSAKESVYRAWFPLTGRWLGFEEARLTAWRIGEGIGEFRADLLAEAAGEVDGATLAGFDGQWLVGDGVVVAAIAVPAGAAQPARRSRR